MTDFDIIAKSVNKKFFSNKYLQKRLSLYNKYNLLVKEIMKKCISKNKNILSSFSQFSKDLKKDRINYKNDYDKLLSKYNILFDECVSDLTMGKPILQQKTNQIFSLEYLLTEKDDIIKSLKNSIKLSKEYRLFREQKRNNYIDIQKGNKEIEDEIKERHQNMLYECKKANKMINKIKKYQKKIKKICNNNQILNNYINKNNKTLLNELSNNSDDKKPKNGIIGGFTKIEDLFDIWQEEGETEEIIDEELHSDDDAYFESKIKQKKKLTIDNIKNKIPNLSLKQIEFNSRKKEEEEMGLYDLERRKYRNKNVFDKVKDIKKKIEKINTKLKSLKIKENIMREYIAKLKGNYNSIRPIFNRQISQTNIFQDDIIFNSLNKETKKVQNQNSDNFLDDIKEIDENYYNENEKSEDKKETKDTRKEEDEIKKFRKNIFTSIKPYNFKPLKNGINGKKLLISLNSNFLKKSIMEDYERPKSK